MVCGSSKERRIITWSSHSMWALKFNVDKAAGGKPEPTGIGGALCNDKWVISCMFSKSIVVRDSNEVDVFAIFWRLR